VTVHKMVQYYSGNNIVAHMHVYIHTQSNNTLYNKTLYRTTLCCGWSLRSLEILEFLFHLSLELNYEHLLCYVKTSHLLSLLSLSLITHHNSPMDPMSIFTSYPYTVLCNSIRKFASFMKLNYNVYKNTIQFCTIPLYTLYNFDIRKIFYNNKL
jgi:hypothetical protein